MNSVVCFVCLFNLSPIDKNRESCYMSNSIVSRMYYELDVCVLSEYVARLLEWFLFISYTQRKAVQRRSRNSIWSTLPLYSL